jgi:hypothetical protein
MTGLLEVAGSADEGVGAGNAFGTGGKTRGGGAGGGATWFLLAASNVLLIMDHSMSNMKNIQSFRGLNLTFLKEHLESYRFIVDKTARHIVALSVGYHSAKIGLEGETVFVHAILQFSTHCAHIHRLFDNFEITVN